MKNKLPKLLLTLLLCLVCFACLFACTQGDEPQTYRVMLSYGDGITVSGENPQQIEEGGTAVFNVSVDSHYTVIGLSDGVYDAALGTVTVENVTRNLNVSIVTEYLGYDTNETVAYFFYGEDGDTTGIANATAVKLGSYVTVAANDSARVFNGWSYGATLAEGGTLLSSERECTFRITPDIAIDFVVRIYPNYSEPNVYYYDANGGKVNAGSDNFESDYYSVELDGDVICVTLDGDYYAKVTAASAFWDDGTFTRENYVLVEYNTAPDGSGESYGLGSKVPTVTDGHSTRLYCIWQEVKISDFEYESYSYALPSSVSASNAPAWNESGVIITAYNGSDSFVTVPEYINGEAVIAIAQGAFENCDMTTLFLSKNLLYVADGAIVGCDKLTRIYFSDGIYSMSDSALDSASYESLTDLFVNATIAPRYAKTGDGAFAIKLSRLISTYNENRVIVVAGSSAYQGLATEYLNRLLDDEYTVINFGTTRTTHILIYLEAMQHFAHEGDIVIYAPENSSYEWGESELYWKTLRDMEGMYNFFRHVDISNYTGVFSAFSSYNAKRYERAENGYEDIYSVSVNNEHGDYQHTKRASYVSDDNYIDAYFVTLNNRVKSKREGDWNKVADQQANKDYTDLLNETWCSVDDESYLTLMNHAINCAKLSGAGVYFGFAPVDAYATVEEARSVEWLLQYDEFIRTTYDFDGLIGSSVDYVLAHEYFYDCAYHTNDYGRAYRTYQLYCDIAALIGKESVKPMRSLGTDFEGCLFETADYDNKPDYQVIFLMQ